MVKRFFDSLAHGDKLTILPLTGTLLSLTVILLTYFFLFKHLPQKLPLFYSLSWGESQLVSKNQFLLLPTLLIFISLFNAFLAFQLHPLQIILKRTLILSLVLINLIIFITALKIMFLFVI